MTRALCFTALEKGVAAWGEAQALERTEYHKRKDLTGDRGVSWILKDFFLEKFEKLKQNLAADVSCFVWINSRYVHVW